MGGGKRTSALQVRAGNLSKRSTRMSVETCQNVPRMHDNALEERTRVPGQQHRVAYKPAIILLDAVLGKMSSTRK